ncbi:hypothetical protein COL28_15850 [Bacillus thuringiensis]|uniref:Uncharacterized protein n=1 Tax=Bacillus cereus TaxID=1396 RepID=A0A9X6URC3_BACCE|nr:MULTISPECIES: hypothetical protein [Bacillus cereus group]PEQ91177.1 hypothetical protein CN475_04840 [Bacillus cereus]PEV38525.1 hypothetical protein CN421_27400 [Bacillus thuringiensis]PFW42544.1 hypothetical protein COL28_15850 [Bacillus thuringiensis]PGV80654.1 hypothetical protein COD85_26915 [Bacillus thuringiensis]
MNIQEFQNNLKELLLENVPEDSFKAFNSLITFDNFTTQILFEIHKDFFNLHYQPKNALQTHVQNEIVSLSLSNMPEDAVDKIIKSTYQQKKRSMKLVKYYKDSTRKYLEDNGIGVSKIDGLEIPELKTMAEKRKGHSLNPLNYDELNNIKSFKLFEYILKKTITKSKNVSNGDFIDAFTKLDDYYQNLYMEFNKAPSMDTLIKIYQIENSYFTNLAYQIANYIEKKNIEEYDLRSLLPLLIITDPSIKFAASNRFMYHRHTYIPELIKQNFNEAKNLAKIVYMKSFLTNGLQIQLSGLYLQLNKDDIETHLFSNYNLAESYSYKKEWNQKKISIVRSIYDIYTRDIPYPKIRT